MTFDGDMHCSDCEWTAGGGNKLSKKKNAKDMACVHTCPDLIKITALSCDFIADDLCYELATHLTNAKVHEKYNSDET